MQIEIEYKIKDKKAIWKCSQCHEGLSEQIPTGDYIMTHRCHWCGSQYDIENSNGKLSFCFTEGKARVEEKSFKQKLVSERTKDTTPSLTRVSTNKIQSRPERLIKKYIKKYSIPYLHHATHKRNLEQILRMGLLSKDRLEKEKLNYYSLANPAVQERRESFTFYLTDNLKKRIHECTPLYISWRTPTVYAFLHRDDINTRDVVHICVDTNRVLTSKEYSYCFVDGNAASTISKQYWNIKNLDKLKWDIIKHDNWGGNQEMKRIKNAEFLIYPKVELKDFYKLVVYDENVKNEIGDLLKTKGINLKVEVDLQYYEWPKQF